MQFHSKIKVLSKRSCRKSLTITLNYNSVQLAGSVLFLLSSACGLDSSYARRSNCQLFLHKDTNLLYRVNGSSHPDSEFVDKGMRLFSSLIARETKSKLSATHGICPVALQKCVVLERSSTSNSRIFRNPST